MGQERVDQAIGRIERALARLEAIDGRLSAERAAADDGGAAGRDYEALALKHSLLRGRVEGAIGQIDRLLAGAERG